MPKKARDPNLAIMSCDNAPRIAEMPAAIRNTIQEPVMKKTASASIQKAPRIPP